MTRHVLRAGVEWRPQLTQMAAERRVGTWFAGIGATVLSGTLVFWLTEGLRSQRKEDPAPRNESQTPHNEGPTPAPSRLTLLDLKGDYTLIKIDPREGSQTLGDLGITIEPESESEGTASYRLPVDMRAMGLGEVLEGQGAIAFTGSQLQIKFGETYSMWRRVELNGRYLVLSWDVKGTTHSWTFERNN